MYVNQFLCGIVATILVEIITFVILVLIKGRKK